MRDRAIDTAHTLFDTDQTRVEVRATSSHEYEAPIFIVFDPSEFIAAAFEAEKSQVIACPPGFKATGTHVRVDLGMLEDSDSLQWNIAHALMEMDSTANKSALDAQSSFWRLWLDVLLQAPKAPPRRDSTIDTHNDIGDPGRSPQTKPYTDTSVPNENKTSRPRSSMTPLHTNLRQAPKRAAGYIGTNTDAGSEETKNLTSKLAKISEHLRRDPVNIGVLQELGEKQNDVVLCLTGLRMDRASDRRAVIKDLCRIQKALKLRAVAIINPEEHDDLIDLNIARYPTVALQKRTAWLTAAPLFLIPRDFTRKSTTGSLNTNKNHPARLKENGATESSNSVQAAENPHQDPAGDQCLEIELEHHPLLRALECDLDAIRVAWTAANGSLRTLLRIGRRALQIAESMENTRDRSN